MTTIISITQVLSPAFSGNVKKKDVLKQIKTGLTYLLVPSALFLILFLLPNQVFVLFFTGKFAHTAEITKALSLPFVVYALANIPILFLLYTVKRPFYILIANVVFFVILTAGSYYLIPIRGLMGAPIAVLVALIANAVLLTIFSVYEYRNIKP